MSSNINLDGGERTIIKALGFGGTSMSGESLFEKCPGFEEAEFVDSLKGLIVMGYVSADSGHQRSYEDMKQTTFQVNSGYSRDLREAISPQPKKKKSRRVRRE